jgi:hypothetical protein
MGSLDDLPKISPEARASDRRVDRLEIEIGVAIRDYLEKNQETTYAEIIEALLRKTLDWTKRGTRAEVKAAEQAREAAEEPKP